MTGAARHPGGRRRRAAPGVRGLTLAALAVAVGACSGPPARGAPGEIVALAVTPDGTLWTIDGATASVLATRDGRAPQRIGGLGTGDDALLDPVDLDPTNGQALFVADRAAGAVVQFTVEGRRAASLAVPDVDPAQPVRQRSRDGRRGQPVAVAAAPDGALYVVDAGRRQVLRLDAEGAVERVLGSAGLLAEPVDVAVADDGTVWVADAGRGVLQAFDPYGAPGPTVAAEPALGRVVGVSVWDSAVALVAARGVTVVDGDAVQTTARTGRQPDVRAAALAGRARWWTLSADGVEAPQTGDPERD